MRYESKFYIAAVGVSAGGQEPLWNFFSHIPPNSGIIFIVIQHLSRDYDSIADTLLAKHTTMPVCWATNHQTVEPNCVYMLPVNKTMTIEGGRLHLQDRMADDRINRAIDMFFCSLAAGEKAHTIGIVLSGAGSDGTLGAIQIHKEHGLVMVQDPETALFPSMPRSAILKEHSTLILSPIRLAEALLDYV
ncbi:MAG: hypothetical protein JWP57_233, partial [Spirosoma sp.]|nr:hypothetical protein [Spirosoma sp.]